jgi:phenylacetic acid degradation operon negative regulatory protein
VTYFYHSVVDSPHLPRDLSHDSTQNAVVTLLGEFWRYSPSLSVPSAALVDLLASMDVSAPAARAALSRLSRKGTLDVSRSGRNTGYSLSPAVAATIPASEMLTMTFGQHDREWDGDWTVIVFSIPETQRDQRQALRDWLDLAARRSGADQEDPDRPAAAGRPHLQVGAPERDHRAA